MIIIKRLKKAKLFDFVVCKGYYAKNNDGRYVFIDKEHLSADLYSSHEGLIESDIETATKTYYKYRPQKFKGVVVGFMNLIVEGYLDVIYEDPVDVGEGIIPENFYVDKRPKKTVKCAIVYYADNKKHYAPLEDIKVIERSISK